MVGDAVAVGDGVAVAVAVAVAVNVAVAVGDGEGVGDSAASVGAASVGAASVGAASVGAASGEDTLAAAVAVTRVGDGSCTAGVAGEPARGAVGAAWQPLANNPTSRSRTAPTLRALRAGTAIIPTAHKDSGQSRACQSRNAR